MKLIRLYRWLHNYTLTKKYSTLLIFALFITALFFVPALMFTIKAASPYCRADDWRFVLLYLKPLFSENIKLQTFWSDPVHPLPVYSLLFILSTKLFNLQTAHIGWITIFSQFFMGLLIIKEAVKSFSVRTEISFFLLIPVTGLCTYLFSFVSHQAYSWPLLTSLIIALFLLMVIVQKINHNFLSNRIYKINDYVTLSMLIVVTGLLFSDWVVIISVSLVLTMAGISIFKRDSGRYIIRTTLTIIVSVVFAHLILEFFLIPKSRGLKGYPHGLYEFLFSHFGINLKTVSVGLLTGVIDFKWFIDIGFSKNTFLSLSYWFMAFYIGIFVLYFVRHLYKFSLFPPAMMLFSLLFLASVVYYRYNPTDSDVFCLVIPRYVIYYQIGIVGLFWSVYLLLLTPNKNSFSNVRNVVLVLVTILLFSAWLINLSKTNKIVNYLDYKYPEVSQQIRDKKENPSIEVPWSCRRGWDISKQLEFLHHHKLNIFAPNYPLQSDVKINNVSE